MKKTLYIIQDGELRRRANSLYFESKAGKKYIPVENTNDICLLGNVNVSKKFLDFCSQKRIPMHYIDSKGMYLGSFYPREFYNSGHTIISQISTYLAPDKRMELAISMLKANLHQTLRVLTYYINRKDGKEKDRLLDIQRELKGKQGLIKDAREIELLHYIHKDMKNTFLDSFNSIYNCESLRLSYNQSKTNSHKSLYLENLGSSLTLSTILTEIYKTHLDPRIGYFHHTDGRNLPLSMDMLLIFEPIFVHRFNFSIVNRKIITSKDFSNQGDTFALNQKGKTKYITEFDNRMRTTIQHGGLNRPISYRRLIRLELYKIQKFIIEGTEYIPFQSRW